MVKGKSSKIVGKTPKPELKDFLEKRRVVDKGTPYTHVSFDPPGKFYIKEHDQEDFLVRYGNDLRKGNYTMTFAEKPDTIGPFRIDMDLKLPAKDDHPRRYYTDKIIKRFIKIIHEVMEGYVDLTNVEEYDESVGEDYTPYKCVLLEKPDARVEEGILKDGFHLHFPFFFVDGWTNTKMCIEISKGMQAANLWKGTPFEEQKDLLDSRASSYNTWMLYGSSKKKGATPYLATKYYDANIDEIKAKEFFEDEMLGRGSSVNYYLPDFLSIRGIKEVTPLKKEILDLRDAEIRSAKRKAALNSQIHTTDAQAAQELANLQQGDIMSMISPDRADKYEEWYRIGQALFTVSRGGQEGLEMWIDFSKSWEHFKEGDCESHWLNMKENRWHIGWLMKCASIDSPERYKEWRNQGIDHLIKKCLEEPKPTEWDLAQLFHKVFEKRFVCAHSKTKEWYEFKNHRWRKLDGIMEVQRVLPTELIGIFIQYKVGILKKLKKDIQNSALDIEEKKCGQVISHLKTNAFQKKVISQCEFLCHDPDFLLKKDENKSLWVCENGVLDLAEGVFRDGKPEDYCTYSCGLHYREYHSDDEEVKYLEKFFCEVFPNSNIRDYFLDNVCSVMEGGNPKKNFIIGTGSGSNGKSVTYALLWKMCGDYVGNFPQQLLLVGNSDSSGAARPDLATARGRRIMIVNELSKGDKINIRVLKELTGNDAFFARKLYGEPETIKPMFKLFMHTNDPPEMRGDDTPSWDRAAFVDFEAMFVLPTKLSDYPVAKTREQQFKEKRFHADETITGRLDDLAPAFLWMMFKRHKIYKTRPMVTPKEVTAATNRQRMKNDFYQQFVDERLQKVKPTKENKKPEMKLTDAWTVFQEWFRESHPQAMEKMNRENFRIELSKKIGKNKVKGTIKFWEGWQILEEDADDGDGEDGEDGDEEGGGDGEDGDDGDE